MEKDLVSIITPAYGAETCLADAVRSVLSQSYSRWEMLIIADDGVDYQDLLQRVGIFDSRLSFYSSDVIQSGPNATRNVGLQRARGEWIAPLDADDVYYPERIERLLHAAQATGLALDNVQVVGERVDDSLALEVGTKPFLSFEDVKSSLVPLLFLFHHRHIPQGWDTDIIRGADTLFNLRGLERAGRAGYVSEPLHEYRVHDQSMCHAPESEDLFVEAYRHTLARLRKDGLGFTNIDFRHNVIEMIEEKQQINHDFAIAVAEGYEGNYQSFVQTNYRRAD
ncbi:MAG: glycosyltransferase [Agarilytica sp.]